MNIKAQLGFLWVLVITMIGLLVVCWVQLFFVDIHLGIIGILICAVPFGYMLFVAKFKIVRR